MPTRHHGQHRSTAGEIDRNDLGNRQPGTQPSRKLASLTICTSTPTRNTTPLRKLTSPRSSASPRHGTSPNPATSSWLDPHQRTLISQEEVEPPLRDSSPRPTAVRSAVIQCDRWRVDAVAVGGLRISFARAGQGSAVVLLGGFVGGAEATWRHQIEALSTDRTVVAWDAPGSGGSADPPDSFRLPDYADCLGEVIAVLNLESPVVVGLSFGGALALEFFRRHRSRVSGLVLAGTYAGWAGSLPPDKRAGATTHEPRGVAAATDRVCLSAAAEHVLHQRPGRPRRRVRRRCGAQLPPIRVPCDGASLRRGRSA